MNNLHQKSRVGVTLIEVLTSIIVAVIGVAGVLVLIPFGIRQAQVGLDLDESTSIADNALALFEIERLNVVSSEPNAVGSTNGGSPALPWVYTGGSLVEMVTPTPINNTTQLDSCFWIDPLWLNTTGAAATNLGMAINNMFNIVSGTETEFRSPADGFLLQPTFVNVLNTAQPFVGGNPDAINLALARRMFQTSNDLEWAFETAPDGTAIDDLDPPRPFLDTNGAGVSLRRQFRGEISWSAVAVARRANGFVDLTVGANGRIEGFDFHVLVYKNRSFVDPGLASFPQDQDPRMSVSGLNLGISPTQIRGTGTIAVQNPTETLEIQNDEWVMLVNINSGVPQVGFFRVIGASNENLRYTLDGSDFVINNPTYMVHLPNVVNVYKRRLELEFADSFEF